MCVGGGGGYSNFEFWDIGRKMNHFWGIKLLWILLGIITEFDYFNGSFKCI